MTYKIREINENDYANLISLFQEFAHFEKLEDKMTNTVDQMKVEMEYINGFVAVNKKNEVIGYVTYFFAYYTWIGKSMYMDDLYVKPAFRGKGIGTLLFNKVIEYAKESNCYKLRWQVSNWNRPAIEFYKKLGAEIDNVENNCDLILD
jgi:GNAT superfamily N-acetyltransferase